MTAFIFFFAASEFLAGLICVSLGAYVLAKSRQRLNWLYFLMTLALFWIGANGAFIIAASSAQLAKFYMISGLIGWLGFFTLFVNFAETLSEARRKLWPLLSLVAAVLFVVFALTDYYIVGMSQQYYGYDYVPGQLNILYILFYLVCVGLGLYSFIKVYRAKEYYRRTQGQIMIIATFIPLVIGTLTDQVFNLIGFKFPPLAIHTIALMIGTIGYAILRYSLITQANPAHIAEATAKELLDPLILIDQSEKINYVNPAASRLTGFRADELVGREIKFIIPSFVGEAEIITELLGKSRRPTGVNLQAFPISGQRGWVLLARDLTEVLRLRKSIQKLNSELNLAVERARKINKFLMSFSGMIEPAKLAILLRDMQTDDFEIATTFKGMDELLGEYSKLYAEKNQLQDESDAKVREIDYLTDVTREQKDLLQKLQTEYEKLTR